MNVFDNHIQLQCSADYSMERPFVKAYLWDLLDASDKKTDEVGKYPPIVGSA